MIRFLNKVTMIITRAAGTATYACLSIGRVFFMVKRLEKTALVSNSCSAS